MARWRLRVAHYLNGHPPDMDIVEWEYKETNRTNGREMRKRYKVPFYMDEGTIVCHEGKGQPDDTVFEGEPGPDMDPIDAEAKAISAKLAHKWKHPIEDLQGQGFSASLLSSLERQVAELASNMPQPPVAVPTSGVSKAEFDQLKEQLAALMAQNAEIQAERGSRRSL